MKVEENESGVQARVTAGNVHLGVLSRQMIFRTMEPEEWVQEVQGLSFGKG